MDLACIDDADAIYDDLQVVLVKLASTLYVDKAGFWQRLINRFGRLPHPPVQLAAAVRKEHRYI